MTHTYAVLEVSAETHHEIHKAFIAAGYHHAIHRDGGDRTVLDMHGVAIASKGPGAQNLEVSSLLSARDGHWKVEIAIDGRIVSQFEAKKAREIGLMLLEAAEAAVSDEAVTIWLKEKVGLDAETAARMLVDLREIRQGTSKAVYPS